MAEPLKDDFRSGAPISQVPASWFNHVANFINTVKTGLGLRWTKSDAGANVIEMDIATETLADFKDSPLVLDTNGATATWVMGGDKGLALDCYCRIAPQTPTSAFSVFQRCRLTFSRFGVCLSATLLPERIRIRASNS
ncbi:MAG: hypothetical protein J6V72_11065 [Kiritimatiellae bacterium]|nr:hypothetical protein [Kiritimatiellia bacterium]